jgi:hypothetical protein
VCVGGWQSESKKITIQATGAISWRKEDIKYRKNECFIDIIESLNLIMSNKGAILRVDVAGQVMVKAFLSGMPECKFGLNDKLLMERSNAAAKKRCVRIPPPPTHTHTHTYIYIYIYIYARHMDSGSCPPWKSL